MNHGDVRALEDEQDPARRKALLERLLATLGPISARELWELIPLERKRDIASGISIGQHAELHWGHIPHMSQEMAQKGWCPECRGKQDEDDEGEATLSFMRVATVDVESLGCALIYGEPCEVGPVLVSCDACYHEWIIGEET